MLMDAGFCRNCGAILRGSAASATLIPSQPHFEGAPPASGPEPPEPPLATAGYFGPPPGRPPNSWRAAPEGTGYPSWPPPPGYDSSPTGSAPPPPWYGPPPDPAHIQSDPHPQLQVVQPLLGGPPWVMDPRKSGRYSVENDRRLRKHMLVFDYSLIGCAGLILATLALPWYSARLGGLTVTAHLLSGNAGVQRALVPVVASLLIVEGFANIVIFRLSDREWRYHRGGAFLLCVAGIIVVGSSAATSPFAPGTLDNLGISLAPGLGAWLAIAGAVLGLLMSIGRAFSGRPALTRMTAVRG
jgi:hypothetical protein